MDRVLVASITPYFVEKGNVWFRENADKILKARATQPFFREHTAVLESGQALSLTELLRKLDELGYEKVFAVRDPGEFSHQGGFVELFPLNADHAVRLEFVGNRVEAVEQLPLTADEEASRAVLRKRLQSEKVFSDLRGLKEGDYVVHLDHGVAQFYHMKELNLDGTFRTYYVLEYAAGDTLLVPMGLERKLSRYVGFGEPKVSRLSSQIWFKTKRKIRKEVEELARALLDLYAKRQSAERLPYETECGLAETLEASFPYEETPDQVQALEDIRRDLAKPEPMDRLVAGDVGFGKTEIALRAMAITVESGRQAALLAPTTVLAYQHFETLQERLQGTAVQVALLSRFQTKPEQQKILSNLKEGTVDILIGTHRLLSQDVEFRNLGLLVIDDEQRFGVKQKEKLREARESLDVLSLSATPIPRTLYMALSSLKGISMVHTPPEGRKAVETRILKRSGEVVREAIQREITRGGQVYYLHNRIGTIGAVKKELERLVPEARIAVAHAKLSEHGLLKVMKDFQTGKYDALVATTIIENGLDLPNVNTLIVEDAAKLGLAQAYQLRGRVGRGSVQAYAYFLYGGKLEGKALLRLQALKEAKELGSGYRVALRDMEIRGAGNILGKEQSGSVNAVGLNLYCQMLSEAVEKLRTAGPAP